MRRKSFLIAGFLILGVMTCRTVRAEAPAEDVSIDADRLSFERHANLVHAEGNVTIRRGAEILRADQAVLHTDTRQAVASGNVVFTRDDFEWRGERFTYNFTTRRWASGAFAASVYPFYLSASAAENLGENEIALQHGSVTTCERHADHAHYRVQARRVNVRPEDRLLARHAVLYLGRWPVLYSPIWRASLNPDFGFHFEPGYRGRMGTYLLSSYRYRINPGWRGQTHLDYRSRRGLAFGQDLDWKSPAGDYDGRFSGYVLHDRDPYLDRDPDGVSIDELRYRGRVEHRWIMTPADSLRAQFEYVSDETMREDYFERAYRRAVQPDNYAAYVHRRDGMALTLLGRARLNDFYEHTDRLPELALDIHRRRLGDSPVYYESRNTAVALRHRWPDRQAREDVAVNRIDSRHGLAWPSRRFGFLNLVPKVGGQLTYYSQTYRTESTEQTIVSWTTNQVVGADGRTNTVESIQEDTRVVETRRTTGAAVRSLMSVGLESSFQAARVWQTGPRPWGEDLRHVIEPYIDYTFVPEPSITPDRLHPFDDIDRLDRRHAVAFGVRNVLQTKRRQQSYDLLDLNVYSSYDFDPVDDRNALGALGLRLEARPDDHWRADITATYDTQASLLDELNARLSYRHASLWSINTDYRYRHEQSRLISGTLTLLPGGEWSFDVYGRYEADDSRLEEHAWHAQRNLDCMSIRGGFSHLPGYTRADGSDQDTEYRVTLEVWLTAFPEMRGGLSSRH